MSDSIINTNHTITRETAGDWLAILAAFRDGLPIQRLSIDGVWVDTTAINALYPAGWYRIKPKPREFWANIFPDGSADLFRDEGQARAFRSDVVKETIHLIEKTK